jgi:hypothetical protein
MNDNEKLRVLIPHWIDHNHEHAKEYLKWAEKVGDVSKNIKDAANALDKVNWALKQALDELGGSVEHQHPPRHVHHH